MYSEEIERMLEKKNNVISQEEYLMFFDPKLSPTKKIKYIKYDSMEDSFLAITDDNYFSPFV